MDQNIQLSLQFCNAPIPPQQDALSLDTVCTGYSFYTEVMEPFPLRAIFTYMKKPQASEILLELEFYVG
jgi:hypothetical protein